MCTLLLQTRGLVETAALVPGHAGRASSSSLGGALVPSHGLLSSSLVNPNPLDVTMGCGALKVDSVKKTEAPAAEAEDIDRSLVERTLAGDKNAFRTLVERYQSRAHAIALGVVGNYEDAEDIAQEAFVKAYRNLASFRGQSSFYTWLYRIIFNLSIDLSRKAYRRSELPMEDTTTLDSVAHSANKDSGAYLSRVAGPDEHIRRVEIRSLFRKALADLTPEHRAVIMLREIEGLSYAEISQVIGCSKGTVMSRLHHARKRLQQALKELMPDGRRSLSAEKSGGAEFEDESDEDDSMQISETIKKDARQTENADREEDEDPSEPLLR